jgi:hypothetical protein
MRKTLHDYELKYSKLEKQALDSCESSGALSDVHIEFPCYFLCSIITNEDAFESTIERNKIG